MHLLSKHLLVKTGPVDYADWNYRAVIGTIQRLRFSLALSLLPGKSERLLEIGFGSGVFMPALNAFAEGVYGIDVHDKGGPVTQALAVAGVEAKLVCSPAETLPFASRSFDAILAISSLEFVQDLPAVCAEVSRVLTPTGAFVVVTPGTSPLVDAGLHILTGNSAKQDFGDRRKAIIPTLLRSFTVDKARSIPWFGHQLVCLYRAFRLTPPR